MNFLLAFITFFSSFFGGHVVVSSHNVPTPTPTPQICYKVKGTVADGGVLCNYPYGFNSRHQPITPPPTPTPTPGYNAGEYYHVPCHSCGCANDCGGTTPIPTTVPTPTTVVPTEAPTAVPTIVPTIIPTQQVSPTQNGTQSPTTYYQQNPCGSSAECGGIYTPGTQQSYPTSVPIPVVTP